MKKTLNDAAALFLMTLSRPGEAAAALLRDARWLRPSALLTACYYVLAAFSASILPPAFIPEVPLEAFGQPYPLCLAVSLPAGFALSALFAAFLPWAGDFFSGGRIGLRVLAALGALMAYFFSFTLLSGNPAAQALTLILPPAAAALSFRRRPEKFPGYFRLVLGFSAPGLLMEPPQLLAILLDSKPVYEISMAIAAVWTIWLLVKALKLEGCPGAARAGAAVVAAAGLYGLLFYNLSLLLPDGLGPLLMMI